MAEDERRRHPPKEIGPPARSDGSLIRLMSDGVEDWVETWTPKGWVKGGASVREYLMAPPASLETILFFLDPRNRAEGEPSEQEDSQMPEVKFCRKCGERIDEETEEYRVIDSTKGLYEHLQCYVPQPEIEIKATGDLGLPKPPPPET